MANCRTHSQWVPGGLATGLGHTYPWSSWGSWGDAKADAKEGDDKWGHGWGLNWGHSWDRAGECGSRFAALGATAY